VRAKFACTAFAFSKIVGSESDFIDTALKVMPKFLIRERVKGSIPEGTLCNLWVFRTLSRASKADSLE
jgi:hypothetical protein